YRPVVQALRLPTDDPARAGAVAAALMEAAEVPFAITELAAEVAQLAADCAQRAGRHPVGDAATASVLAAAACRAAAMLVSLNLEGVADDRPGQAAQLAEQAAIVSQHALGRAHGE
ncbi:MAG: cyclodeaminase/cyclohydrolase family protein, partial [Solirubrobacteraceae bacterium]